MMKSMFRKKGVASIRELLDVARESGVRLIACQMTMDVFGLKQEDFIEGVEFGGAAAFLSEARKSHVTLVRLTTECSEDPMAAINEDKTARCPWAAVPDAHRQGGQGNEVARGRSGPENSRDRSRRDR